MTMFSARIQKALRTSSASAASHPRILRYARFAIDLTCTELTDRTSPPWLPEATTSEISIIRQSRCSESSMAVSSVVLQRMILSRTSDPITSNLRCVRSCLDDPLTLSDQKCTFQCALDYNAWLTPMMAAEYERGKLPFFLRGGDAK